jgi:hypothetical protein
MLPMTVGLLTQATTDGRALHELGADVTVINASSAVLLLVDADSDHPQAIAYLAEGLPRVELTPYL